MRVHQRCSRAVAVLTAVLFLMAAHPTSAEIVANDIVPLDLLVSVTCDSTLVDMIHLTGDLHVKITQTVDQNGGVHTTTLFHPSDASGVGLITGDTYRGVGMTGNTSQTFDDGDFVFTFINNFHMVGTAGGTNYNVRDRVIVVFQNGELRVDHEAEAITCQ